jgi:cysteine desulfuration protein SufE
MIVRVLPDSKAMSSAPLDEILSNFELLEDWEERYRYLIELGRRMPPLPDEARNDRNKVMGCASQVWLESLVERPNDEPVLRFRGDSDSHIVRGLIALLITLLSGRPAPEIIETDPQATLRALGSQST